ncbi:CCW12 [Candida jiufengensis]|uniref:CCW12 n=1 Tax=Candida jiufengensis TaxID=497108 RepID=UPI0022246666|nr:CCW12 [Candida jiufengensis]KAI5954628.1 CCW12 [Candida jiufengensis]
MQFSTLFTIAATLVSSSLATTSFEWETVYESYTTELTITSCSDNKCETTVNKVIPSIASTTVEGVLTVYTTYCPLTESSSDVIAPTPSSIAGVASTLSTVVTTIHGVETVYTTYCPLTDSQVVADVSTPIAPIVSSSSLAAVASSTPVATAPAAPVVSSSSIAAVPVSPSSSSESDIYVDFTITPTVSTTENVLATETAQSTLFTSSLAASNSSLADVSTFEGSGSKLVVGGFAAVAGIAVALI